MVIAAISSGAATVYGAYYASQQYEMSRKALTMNDRNRSFSEFMVTVKNLCGFMGELDVSVDDLFGPKDVDNRVMITQLLQRAQAASDDLNTWLDTDEREQLTRIVQFLNRLFMPFALFRLTQQPTEMVQPDLSIAGHTTLVCEMFAKDVQTWFSTGVVPREFDLKYLYKAK